MSELKPDAAIEVLERTPRVLSAMLAGLSETWLLATEGPDTFSPRDVLGHLVWGEETDWLARAEIILEHGPDKPFEPFDRFAFRTAYEELSLDELLRKFADLRARNLARLRGHGIGEEQLAREGTHPALGRVTLSQLLSTWVAHDLSHIRQIARVMAKQYKDAVGPWREYLRVMEE